MRLSQSNKIKLLIESDQLFKSRAEEFDLSGKSEEALIKAWSDVVKYETNFGAPKGAITALTPLSTEEEKKKGEKELRNAKKRYAKTTAKVSTQILQDKEIRAALINREFSKDTDNVAVSHAFESGHGAGQANEKLKGVNLQLSNYYDIPTLSDKLPAHDALRDSHLNNLYLQMGVEKLLRESADRKTALDYISEFVPNSVVSDTVNVPVLYEGLIKKHTDTDTNEPVEIGMKLKHLRYLSHNAEDKEAAAKQAFYKQLMENYRESEINARTDRLYVRSILVPHVRDPFPFKEDVVSIKHAEKSAPYLYFPANLGPLSRQEIVFAMAQILGEEREKTPKPARVGKSNLRQAYAPYCGSKEAELQAEIAAEKIARIAHQENRASSRKMVR